MQEVGELHVDRFHGACVLHDPMFVHIGGIVVARGAERAKGKEKGDGYVKKKCIIWVSLCCRLTRVEVRKTFWTCPHQSA